MKVTRINHCINKTARSKLKPMSKKRLIETSIETIKNSGIDTPEAQQLKQLDTLSHGEYLYRRLQSESEELRKTISKKMSSD